MSQNNENHRPITIMPDLNGINIVAVNSCKNISMFLSDSG